jgi:hypothetical protein
MPFAKNQALRRNSARTSVVVDDERASAVHHRAVARTMEEHPMKRLVLLGVLMTALSSPLLAAKNSEKFDLPWNVVLDGVQVPAGQCEVTWTETSGTDVQLTIKTADKKTVTVRAIAVEGEAEHTGPVTSVVDGVRHLKGFRTKNSSFTIEAEPAATR